jgi:predicted nucleic acid-binding protein
MGEEKGLAFIDSNVFVIDLRYKRDRNYRLNRIFLDIVADLKIGVTGVFNLLEICGILSFNLSEGQLVELYEYLPERYKIGILPYHDRSLPLPALRLKDLLVLIAKRMSLGDALTLAVAEQESRRIEAFISWDAQHFVGKTSLLVQTPKDFVDARGRRQ